MDSGGFVFEEVDQFHLIEAEEKFCIKEEVQRSNVKEEEVNDYNNFEDDESERVPQPKYIAFENDSEKCGEVMIARGGELTFVCLLCTRPFIDPKAFGSHMKDSHVKKKSEVDREIVDSLPRSLVESAKVESLDGNVFLVESSDDDACPPFTKSGNHGSPTSTLVTTVCESDQNCEGLQSSNYLTVRSNENVRPVDSRVNVKNASVNMTLKTCKYCDQQFTNFWTFKAHVISHKGPKRFVCPHCPKKFVSTTTRNAHVNTHTGERPHKCPHCPSGFAHRANLEKHIHAHMNFCKFSCKYCGKRFVQSGSQKIHERMHTGEKPYQCEECGKRFSCQMRLTLHSRTHSNIKNHKCPVCGKGFHSGKRKKEHMRKHSDERPFHCSTCGQNFPRRASLRAHEELHSEVKKYVCGICGKAFAQYAGLYSHKKSHTEKPA